MCFETRFKLLASHQTTLPTYLDSSLGPSVTVSSPSTRRPFRHRLHHTYDLSVISQVLEVLKSLEESMMALHLLFIYIRPLSWDQQYGVST